jgi:hypothetical protein
MTHHAYLAATLQAIAIFLHVAEPNDALQISRVRFENQAEMNL